jgi:hypothetical protein
MLQNRGMMNHILPLSGPTTRHHPTRPLFRRRLCRSAQPGPAPIVQRLPRCEDRFAQWRGHAARGDDPECEPWWQTALGCLFLALVWGLALLVL